MHTYYTCIITPQGLRHGQIRAMNLKAARVEVVKYALAVHGECYSIHQNKGSYINLPTLPY